MWWVSQETPVLSLCEYVTNRLCLEEFAYQYISKETNSKKINQKEEHRLTIRLWNLLNQHITYVTISFCNLLLMINHISVFETIISAPLMGCRNKCNFKDATKGKKAAKDWSKLDVIFKQTLLTLQLMENKQNPKPWASLKMLPLLF